ncbi:MAG: hypothetical protein F4X02_09025 [Chloroflexi bacterium]|nr:hypothetical protein [Chloroflexota bacterium]
MTYRKILLFWFPLALAWLMMALEAPWVQGVISRKPDSETQLAAFGLVFSLSILIETPIIMLLATSNALARDRQSYQRLWRFMLAINLCVGGIAVLMAFTPLLDLYLGSVLNIPAHIIEAARPGMKIMICWGAFIGYRRFHQGIVIRFGNTHYVGIGTAIRVLVSGSVAVALGAITNIAGAQIGALALAISVLAETAYTHIISRPDVRRLLDTPRQASLPDLTYRQVLRFHIPLAITSLVSFLIYPAIERGLANTPDAVQSLAAWPVLMSIMFATRAGGMAYQEVVISLDNSERNHRLLRNFTLRLGFALSSFMLVFAFTPLISIYVGGVLGVPEALRELVELGAQAAILVPLLTTLQSYFRALLMLSQRTATIYQAISLGFVTTALTVWGGIALDMPGIMAAALGLTLGQLLELGILYFAYRRRKADLRLHWQSAVAAA